MTRMHNRCGRSLAVVLGMTCLLLLERDARSQGAEDMYQEAVVRFSMARFAKSISLLNRAKQKTKDPKLLGRIYLYLGLNHAVMGKHNKAKQAFRTALVHNPNQSLDPKRFKMPIVEMFGLVRDNMRGEVVVTADQDDALVLVDGKEVGKVPLSTHLPIGSHQVEVRSVDGSMGYTEPVLITFDQKQQVTAQLKPLYGILTVRSPQVGAEVLLDDTPVGTTPMEKVAVSAGRHELTVRLQGYQPHNMPVQIPPEQEAILEVRLEPVAVAVTEAAVDETPGQRRLWTWITAGAAGAALAVGIGLAVSSHMDYSEYEDPDTPPDRVADLEDSIETKDRASYAMFGLTGVLAAGAVVLYFFEPRWFGGQREGANHATLTDTWISPTVGRAPGLLLGTQF